MKEKVLNLIVIFAVVILLIEGGRVHGASDADIIPPEVLKQMDPDIREGNRPTIAKIRQSDIFGLRENPKFDEDFVTFDFKTGDLSIVQRNIINNWVRSGANIVYLKDDQITKYSVLLEQSSARSWPDYGRKLLRHVVNTDCKLVSFGISRKGRPGLSNWSSARFNSFPGYEYFSNLPSDSVIIVEGSNGTAVCGMFRLGEGTVYFCNTAHDSDSRRWYLNYMHWALGLGVPGAADTGILGGGSSGLTLKESVKYDAMILKNGDTITGTIENETFKLKTSYSNLTFELSKIAKIVFEGAGSNVDVVRLKVGDKLSGVVQDKKIKIKLVSGTSVEIDKDKVKEIQIRKTKTEKEKD